MFRKILFWLVVAFLVYYMITHPSGAASALHTSLDAVRKGINGIIHFFGELAK